MDSSKASVAFVLKLFQLPPEPLALQRFLPHWQPVPVPVVIHAQLCSRPFTDSPRKEVYFMAIIDILTHYDAKKKAAHAAKTVKHGVSISVSFPPQLPGP